MGGCIALAQSKVEDKTNSVVLCELALESLYETKALILLLIVYQNIRWATKTCIPKYFPETVLELLSMRHNFLASKGCQIKIQSAFLGSSVILLVRTAEAIYAENVFLIFRIRSFNRAEKHCPFLI